MAVRLATGKYRGFRSARLLAVARKSAALLRRPKDDLAIVFLATEAIREMNRAYRGIDRPTDVLSFPAAVKGDLGDIFIAPSAARKKAASRGQSYAAYLDLLVAHSVLHLGGYDHRTARQGRAMELAEGKILKRL